jgi:uncharacterized membrane protein
VVKEFINPNWHVILIHYPLGVFVLGMLVELFSFLYRRSAVRTAARWMIALGALSMIPSALTGLYAMANVVRMDLPEGASDPDRPWREVTAASRLNAEQWEFLGRHVWAQASATALAVVLVTIAVGCSDRVRRKIYFPIGLGLLCSLAALVWGAYYGGEMVYRHGTGVLRVQEKGTMAETSQPKPVESAADEQTEKKAGLEDYVPPLQLHVLLAGLSVAFAFGALGLSMRSIAKANEPPEEVDVPEPLTYGPMVVTPPPALRGPGDLDVVRSINPDADVPDLQPPRMPVSRVWVFASLLGIGAALAGAWFLGGMDESHTWEPKRLWAMVSPSQRRLWHVITGGAVVVVPLILALVMRVSRSPKFLLTVLGLLLVAAVALQVWLGTLLMLDTPGGSIARFNGANGATTEPAVTDPFTTAPAVTEPADTEPTREDPAEKEAAEADATEAEPATSK